MCALLPAAAVRRHTLFTAVVFDVLYGCARSYVMLCLLVGVGGRANCPCQSLQVVRTRIIRCKQRTQPACQNFLLLVSAPVRSRDPLLGSPKQQRRLSVKRNRGR
jgi:hypothetical protein